MPTKAQLIKDFKMYDENGDGLIQASEFIHILQGKNPSEPAVDEGTAKMILDSIMKAGHDTDGDGQVSIEELAAALADEPDDVLQHV
jgi:Ca2+-binding EF-hand superfamily protein